MRRFYAPPEQISEHSIELGTEETRHLRDVLRLDIGSQISIFDGEGREFLCTVAMIGKKSSSALIKSETDPASPESDLELSLAVALLKGEKFDLVVQKAVELGARCIQPLYTKRADVKFALKDSKTDRWRKIALEAAKQSGRALMTQINNPVGFEDFARSSAAVEGDTQRFLFSEKSGKSLPLIESIRKITAVIGPEGGWEDSELEVAANNGFTIVTLGGRVLRAETAAIAVTAILQHRFGDVN